MRRERNADHSPLWANACYWSAVTVAIALFLGCTVSVVSPDCGACIIGLGMLLVSVFFAVTFSCHAFRVLGTLGLLLLRIPVVLFLQARMHLLELVLIVALLGNSVGLIVGHTEGADPGTKIFLCVLCVTVVLGGSAWSLWVCTSLRLQSALSRCVLVLSGVLTPAACLGLFAAFGWLCVGLAHFPNEQAKGLFRVGLALATGTVSFCVLRHVISYHRKAWNAVGSARVEEWRHRARQKRECSAQEPHVEHSPTTQALQV